MGLVPMLCASERMVRAAIPDSSARSKARPSTLSRLSECRFRGAGGEVVDTEAPLGHSGLVHCTILFLVQRTNRWAEYSICLERNGHDPWSASSADSSWGRFCRGG